MDHQQAIPDGVDRGAVIQETLQLLTLLAGEWTGRGRGEYPTIESFDYRETFRFQHDPQTAYLTYEQRTEIIDTDGHPIRKSHWEAGVIRPMHDGTVELACVQSSGRVETLLGIFQDQDSHADGILLSFASELIGNDGRVIRSSRVWRAVGNRLEYEMNMETTKVGELRFHVGSKLKRR